MNQHQKWDLDKVLVAHVSNPSYLRGRDQEDHALKPAEANSWCDPISKILNTKQG
jgi:hypothetical protein